MVVVLPQLAAEGAKQASIHSPVGARHRRRSPTPSASLTAEQRGQITDAIAATNQREETCISEHAPPTACPPPLLSYCAFRRL
ncbi:hypothetical protein AXA44_45630 [Rhodococcus sp. SC4]|nr:hypothetical protein AXA44_45630 [Rhodococcus sp. SC4]